MKIDFKAKAVMEAADTHPLFGATVLILLV